MAPPPDMLGQILWQLGFAICHQIPERSFFIGGYQMPICARDTGLFLGFAMVLLMYATFGRRRRIGAPDRAVLAYAAVSTAFFLFDALGSYSGIITATVASRSASGLMFGSSVGILITAAYSKVVFEGDETRPVYRWTDLGILAMPMALTFIALNSMDLGIAGYYLFAIIAEIGFLLMVGSILLLLINIAKERLFRLQGRWRLQIFVVIVLESLLVASMYAFHSYGLGLILT